MRPQINQKGENEVRAKATGTMQIGARSADIEAYPTSQYVVFYRVVPFLLCMSPQSPEVSTA